MFGGNFHAEVTPSGVRASREGLTSVNIVQTGIEGFFFSFSRTEQEGGVCYGFTKGEGTRFIYRAVAPLPVRMPLRSEGEIKTMDCAEHHWGGRNHPFIHSFIQHRPRFREHDALDFSPVSS